MTTTVLKLNGMAQLPTNPLSVAMSFLEPQEVAQAESVCTSWNKVIGSKDQQVWKMQCINLGIPFEIITTPLLAEQTVLGSQFSSGILNCIAGYALDNKDRTKALRANIRFSVVSRHIYDISEMAFDCHKYDWDSNGADEPFMLVSYGASKGRKLAAAFSEFPEFVPLRLFIDKTGSYKNHGDKILLVFQGKRLILTCLAQTERYDNRLVTSLSQAAEKRVEMSLRTRFMTGASLEGAKTLAKAAGDWIVVKEKKKSE